MMDFGGWVLRSWGWLNTAAQEAAGTAAVGGVAAPGFPFWQNLLKMAIVLSAMLGVLILGLYLWKRSGFLRPQGVSPMIQVLSTHYLAPKKALILVAVGKERLLLASAGEQLQLLTSLAPETLPDLAASSPLTAKGNELEGNGS